MRSFAVSCLLLHAALAQAPAVGDKVADATFPPFLNGDGRQSLSEFYGQPIVIDRWGIH